MQHVHAYHNVAVDPEGRHIGFFGYRPEHPVTLVFAADIDSEVTDSATCEAVWRLLNIGHDPDFGEPNPLAVAYREAGNRSMSVGDVIEVDGRFFAVTGDGYAPIEAPHLDRATIHGTTYLREGAGE